MLRVKSYKCIRLQTTCRYSGVRRKLSWGGFHSVAYGGHLFMVCGLCDVTIWHHFHVSKPMFWGSLL